MGLEEESSDKENIGYFKLVFSIPKKETECKWSLCPVIVIYQELFYYM